ncbi:MAG: FAD-binding oxidoreductase [Rhizobiaceae bacterium]|nr:FAD-binding oxidoreductase [Rhizobiaceae bacterium]
MSEGAPTNWGRTVPAGGRRSAEASSFRFLAAGRGLPGGSQGAVLPYGNGRSYGDSCLNDHGTLIDSRASARILSFDPETGLVEAEAGLLLSEVTRLAAPHGWFLSVTPGTQFVTLGGAVANDVHGKNHHVRGTFGRWVRAFRLERSDRGPLDCSLGENTDLFRATIGGMGLTGLILRVTLQLLKVPSLSIDETTTRFDALADYFRLAEEADGRHEYAVAWIDSLASGASLGRGHLIAGDHAAEGSLDGTARPPLTSIPFTPPVSPLRGLALKAFNEVYFRKSPAGTSRRSVAFDGFFYPLDRIGAWNRLYGPNGLHQHQSVVPFQDAERVVRALLECAGHHRQGSFLTVLKRFGPAESPGLLSFARPGYTLTLDFPHRGTRTLALLDELDALVVSAGGAVNPYKDSRMAPQTFAASFPEWRALEAMRDPAVLSDFWRRTAMTLAAHDCDDRVVSFKCAGRR